jgi:L-fuconolactonase
MKLNRIDAHQHFWRVSRADYPWMPSEGPLRKDYLPIDLRNSSLQAGVIGSVLVQAAPTVNETEYLLGMADTSSEILGVVGWFDLEDSSFENLARLAANPKLVGVRPMIQDIEDDAWIAKRGVIDGLKQVASFGLTFDLLCHPRHLSYAIPVFEKIPELRVVIDHMAKPDYTHVETTWLEGMTELASFPNVYCKVAGLVTEVGAQWKPSDFSKHLEIVFGLFGANRLMFGTDWPVLNTVASYDDVIELYDSMITEFSDTDKMEIWSGSASRFYGLSAGIKS